MSSDNAAKLRQLKAEPQEKNKDADSIEDVEKIGRPETARGRGRNQSEIDGRRRGRSFKRGGDGKRRDEEGEQQPGNEENPVELEVRFPLQKKFVDRIKNGQTKAGLEDID